MKSWCFFQFYNFFVWDLTSEPKFFTSKIKNRNSKVSEIFYYIKLYKTVENNLTQIFIERAAITFEFKIIKNGREKLILITKLSNCVYQLTSVPLQVHSHLQFEKKLNEIL